MKHLRFFFIALALAFPALMRAESVKVTTLSTSAPAVIIKVGYGVNMLTIHNVGSGQVNITILQSDGTGVTPTTSTTGLGIPIAAGQFASFYGPWLQGKQISAIMASSTTQLNINTDAPTGNSTFPTS